MENLVKLSGKELIEKLTTTADFTEVIKAIDTSLGYARIMEEDEERQIWYFESHDVYISRDWYSESTVEVVPVSV